MPYQQATIFGTWDPIPTREERRAAQAELIKKLEAELLEAKHRVVAAGREAIGVSKACARVDALEKKLAEAKNEQI